VVRSSGAALGLSGRVRADDMEALLEGRDPISGTPLGNVLRDRVLSGGKVVRRMSRFVLKFGGDPELAQAT
jgi:hypothetical protein